MTDALEACADELGSSEESKKAEREVILAPLRAQYKFIRWWELDGFGLIVCRRLRKTETLAVTKLSEAANKAFEATGDASTLVDANESCVKTTCVYPKDRDSLKRAFDEYPNFSSVAALAISKMADEGITAGKE